METETMIINVLWSLSPLILILLGFFLILKLRKKLDDVREGEDEHWRDNMEDEMKRDGDPTYPGSSAYFASQDFWKEDKN